MQVYSFIVNGPAAHAMCFMSVLNKDLAPGEIWSAFSENGRAQHAMCAHQLLSFSVESLVN